MTATPDTDTASFSVSFTDEYAFFHTTITCNPDHEDPAVVALAFFRTEYGLDLGHSAVHVTTA